VVPELTDGAELHHRPSDAQIRAALAALAPWRALAAPRFHGIEHVPTTGAVLLVGNHSIYGLLDPPLMAAELYVRRGRFLRSLAEHAHYRIPGWWQFLQAGGAVRGTRDNCRALFAAGEAVLVFPGGGREVAKRKGEHYQLVWKQRTGFARMAIECGVPIVPFAAVGIEDAYDIVVDADHPIFAPVRRVAERFGARWDLAPPVARGLGPTPLPRPERLYYSFGPPIRTADWDGLADDPTALEAMRGLVQDSIYAQLAALRAAQAVDPHRHLRGRLRTGLARRLNGYLAGSDRA
jgi:1-acyl-sn-glycerol-3-phosphate acyltransferase